MWNEWRGLSIRDTRKLYRKNKPNMHQLEDSGYRIHHRAIFDDNPELLRLLMTEPDGIHHAVCAKYVGADFPPGDLYRGMVPIVMAVLCSNIGALELLYPHVGRGEKFFWKLGAKRLSLISIAARLGSDDVVSWIEGREGCDHLDPDSAALRAVKLSAGDVLDVHPFSGAMGPVILQEALLNPRTPSELIRNLLVRHRVPMNRSPRVAKALMKNPSVMLDLFKWGYRPKGYNFLFMDLIEAKIRDVDRLNIFRNLISLCHRPHRVTDIVAVFMAPSLYLEACHRRPTWIENIPNAVTIMLLRGVRVPEVCARVRTVIELCDIDPSGEPLRRVVEEGYVDATRMLLSLPQMDLTPYPNHRPPWAVLQPSLYDGEFYDRHFECVVMVLEAMRIAGHQIPPVMHPIHQMMCMQPIPYDYIDKLLNVGLVPWTVDMDSIEIPLTKFGWTDYELSVLIKYFGSVPCDPPDAYEFGEIFTRIVAVNFLFIPRGSYWALDVINAEATHDPLSLMMMMAHTWGPMLFMAMMQPHHLVSMFQSGAHLPPDNECADHPDPPPACPKALALRRDIIRGAAFGWSPTRHYLFPELFQGRVVHTIMIANRLSIMTALPPLPLEMWFHVFSFLGR